jgi:integrase
LKTPITCKTKTKSRSPASVNRELSLLSKIFTIAIRAEEVRDNPCRNVGRVKGEQGRTRHLLPEEEARLLAVLVDERLHLYAIVMLHLNTGVRSTELLTLKPGHVDFHRDIVYVTKTKTDVDREVPMNNTARRLLTDLVDNAKKQGNEYLFMNLKTGTRLKSIKTAWRTACRKAGIENLRVHDLRHTFGTRAADRGSTLASIKEIMGHSSSQTTERYIHATDDGKRWAVESVETKQNNVVPILAQRKVSSR